MQRHERALRQKRFEESSSTMKIASLQAMVVDFERIVLDLSEQIEAEELRTGNRDPAHYAYSTLAKAARVRRPNLLLTIADLKARLDAAKNEHDALMAGLRSVESHAIAARR